MPPGNRSGGPAARQGSLLKGMDTITGVVQLSSGLLVMRPLRYSTVLCVGAVLIAMGAACTRAGEGALPDVPPGPIAEVDRIVVPDRIGTTDALTVRLRGTVGPNGCYSLARVAATRGGNRGRLTPLVDPPARRDAMCTMAIVPLDKTVRLAPPFDPGTFTITVPQGAGAAVTTTVEVVE